MIIGALGAVGVDPTDPGCNIRDLCPGEHSFYRNSCDTSACGRGPELDLQHGDLLFIHPLFQ